MHSMQQLICFKSNHKNADPRMYPRLTTASTAARTQPALPWKGTGANYGQETRTTWQGTNGRHNIQCQLDVQVCVAYEPNFPCSTISSLSFPFSGLPCFLHLPFLSLDSISKQPHARSPIPNSNQKLSKALVAKTKMCFKLLAAILHFKV